MLLGTKIFGSGSLRDKAAALNKLQQKLDRLDDAAKQAEFDKLSQKTQHQLDELWDCLFCDRGRSSIPVSNGKWSGEPGDSMWIPDDDFVPANKKYNNMHERNWREIKAANHLSVNGFKFIDGRVDFSPISRGSVSFDWEKELGQDGMKYMLEGSDHDRQYLHNAAFRLLARDLGKSFEEVKAFKEKENLVWNEETDCATLLLVPREVHDNITHFGGIKMAQIVYF